MQGGLTGSIDPELHHLSLGKWSPIGESQGVGREEHPHARPTTRPDRTSKTLPPQHQSLLIFKKVRTSSYPSTSPDRWGNTTTYIVHTIAFYLSLCVLCCGLEFFLRFFEIFSENDFIKNKVSCRLHFILGLSF